MPGLPFRISTQIPESSAITGRIVKGTGQTEMKPAKMSHVKYVHQSKEQYMMSLKRCLKTKLLRFLKSMGQVKLR